MEILSSSHAKHCLGYHIIFCPKYRHQVLKDAVEIELKRILGEICKTYGWILHALEIMPDHVHVFVQADHTTAPVEIAKTMKSISAVHIFNTFKDLKKRRFWGSGMWSDGTFYSSVGGVSEEAVKRYIETQKQRGDLLSRRESVN
ncbi:transposase IS200-family protein [Nostoc commune NIES-4072]|uniref:Transposase IS200-family protein n=1 Tax=Nostoc commune NIES-4072 TaxID=2005467 RepID=A0A2R5FR92_NOSCO|nr:IS200/IS605 family transposase [Nostoc commune]BBD65080.1 transposase IS200-family protein [Nostoc commune HK-02]BBD67746.1 transposase IS200-family protein [Nostoc commune HK-02]GBG17595.1 transposase IS200-family protein [Nostoc commune NIES-4072]GBG21272.1 transposase IS200-family protein [Nostoc commune NIES-4072]